jgi:hypothetical protein
MFRTALFYLGPCLLGGLMLCAQPQPPPLHRFDLPALAATNAGAARMVAGPGGGKKALLFKPGGESTYLSLPGADSVPWGRAAYLVCEVYHENDFSVVLHLDFYSRNGEKDSTGKDYVQVATRYGVLPRLPTRVVLPLNYLDAQNIFPPKYPRQLKGGVQGRRMRSDETDRVHLWLAPVEKGYGATLTIRDVYLSTEMPPPLPAPAAPVVDPLGQWTAKDWPGKTRSEAELKTRLLALEKDAAPRQFPAGWSRYGGYKAKPFKATGYFRTHHDGQRWWLVDPEGYAFLSVGVDVVRPDASGPVAGMEDLLAWLPRRDDPQFKDAWSGDNLSFHTVNLIRAFGPQWRRRWETMTAGLTRQWRFNTVANWSDRPFIKSAGLPYVIDLDDFPTTGKKLFRDFPDVFDPAYRAEARRFAGQLAAVKNDPLLIGYFLSNEPHWAFGNHNLAFEMLGTAEPSFTKKELVRSLKKQYGGDLNAFNAAWKLSLPGFEALETTVLRQGSQLTDQSWADLKEFSNVMVDAYVKTVCDEVKAVDPNHLNLGLRYAYISSDLCYRAGAYFDVFSINGYSSPMPPNTAEVARRSGKPVMIGEFHFGATDRGLPATGIQGAADQVQRGVAYRHYVEGGLARPEVVGLHYFQWNDQPVLGRFDGENYNIGLVDVCNQPYPELTEAVRQTNERLYEVAAGKQKPYDKLLKKAPQIYY